MMRRKSTYAHNLLGAIEEAERQEAHLAKLREKPVPLVVRLAQLLLKKQLRSTDLMRQWDVSGDGAVSFSEFRDNVLGLGMQAEARQHASNLSNLSASVRNDADEWGGGTAGGWGHGSPMHDWWIHQAVSLVCRDLP